jgi:hypothetical protein
MRTSRFSTVPADLFFVSPSCQIPHPYSRPAELRHNLCKTTKRARCSLALRDLKKIQQRLTADALQPVEEVNFAAHALEREPPGIGSLLLPIFV